MAIIWTGTLKSVQVDLH